MKIKTLKGAASLYVVAFVTLLLGIISLSFIRVMVSNSARNMNTDLSQSALDAAQAGIEDARVAILRYHECLSSPSKSGCSGTNGIIAKFRNGVKNNSCDTVSSILGRNTTDSGNEAVVIQETQSVTDAGNSASMLQAYTCVKISEELPDYRTTLDNDSRSRIIPIRVDENKLKDVKKIDVAWFSDVNAHGTNTYGNADGSLAAASPSVPMLSVQFFQADNSFKLSELNVQSADGNGRTDHFNVFLNPVLNAAATPVTLGIDLSANKLASSAGKGPDAQRYFNVTCNDVAFSNAADEFACRARLNLPKTFNNTHNRNETATFLYINMPTGGATTDLSIILRDDSDNIIPFFGVQALVDSTGRANDLYRRLETRLELLDIYYPYPDYELEQSGNGPCTETDEAGRAGCIRKKTIVAEKCWYTIVMRDGTARVQECPIVTN